MSEADTLVLEPDTVQKLVELGRKTQTMSASEIREMFPHELSAEDVGVIGGHVLRAAEAQRTEETIPSSDVEGHALFMIGYTALGRLDIGTTDRVIDHLDGIEGLMSTLLGKRLMTARDTLLLA